MIRMDFKQTDRVNSVKNESAGRETGECVEEPVESSTRGMFDLPLDVMQEMTDERDRLSPDLGLSPGRSYGGVMLSPSDPMYYERQREVMYSPSADNYPYNYASDNSHRTYSGMRTGTYFDHERDYGGLGYQGPEYNDSNLQYDASFRSGLGGNGNRWEGYRDRYGNVQRDPLSPRYMDGQRWGDLDEDRYASPSLPDNSMFFGRGIQPETDSYPSSYTYGMPHQRRGSFANSTYGAAYPSIRERYNDYYREGDDYHGDYLPDRMRSRFAYNDAEFGPFSNPSSPTPINHFPVFSDGENYNRSHNMSPRGYSSMFTNPSSASNMTSFGYSSYSHAPYEDRFSPSTSGKYHQYHSNRRSPPLPSHLSPNLSSSNNASSNVNTNANGNGHENDVKDGHFHISNSNSLTALSSSAVSPPSTTTASNTNAIANPLNRHSGEKDTNHDRGVKSNDLSTEKNNGNETGNQSSLSSAYGGMDTDTSLVDRNSCVDKNGENNCVIPTLNGKTTVMESLSSSGNSNDKNDKIDGNDESNETHESNDPAENTKEDDNFQINARAIMQNQEERTVVLIRNIPNRYKIADLSNVIGAYVDGRGVKSNEVKKMNE